MLSGVLSDEYIKAKCWEQTAPLSFKKAVGMKPIHFKPSGNMRREYTFVQQQPTIVDLATNIVAVTPRKNLPANTDIVSYVSDSLLKTQHMLTTFENPMFEVTTSKETEALIRSENVRNTNLPSLYKGTNSGHKGTIYTSSAGGTRGGMSNIPDYPEEPRPLG
jgi:hypothetical protein